MSDDDDLKLRLAIALYEIYDLRFSRKWEDLPQDVRDDYLEDAQTLMDKMDGNEDTPSNRSAS